MRCVGTATISRGRALFVGGAGAQTDQVLLVEPRSASDGDYSSYQRPKSLGPRLRGDDGACRMHGRGAIKHGDAAMLDQGAVELANGTQAEVLLFDLP